MIGYAASTANTSRPSCVDRSKRSTVRGNKVREKNYIAHNACKQYLPAGFAPKLVIGGKEVARKNG
jgi:hypothetical protein